MMPSPVTLPPVFSCQGRRALFALTFPPFSSLTPTIPPWLFLSHWKFPLLSSTLLFSPSRAVAWVRLKKPRSLRVCVCIYCTVLYALVTPSYFNDDGKLLPYMSKKKFKQRNTACVSGTRTCVLTVMWKQPFFVEWYIFFWRALFFSLQSKSALLLWIFGVFGIKGLFSLLCKHPPHMPRSAVE